MDDGGLFSQLFAKLGAIVGWFGDLFTSVFTSLWDLLRDGFAWAFEQVLNLATSVIGSFDVSALSGGVAAAGSIPSNVLAVMSAVGLDKGLAIIAAAIVIRFLLQLIPFVRLGS